MPYGAVTGAGNGTTWHRATPSAMREKLEWCHLGRSDVGTAGSAWRASRASTSRGLGAMHAKGSP